MLKTNDFDYVLPPELIAQTPLEKRDSSRLLVYKREDLSIEHRIFTDLSNYLSPGDVLVINDTKVLPARILGVKEDTKALMEILLLKRHSLDTWEVLMRPGKRAKIGTVINFSDKLRARVTDILDDGRRMAVFSCSGAFEEILDELGLMPLPPYIKEKLKDKNRYQTVYAENTGSAAAPTAGLHFTKELLKSIQEKGIHIVPITLHVGLGTFRPVSADIVEEHKMHTESYSVSEESAEIMNNAKRAGKRVIAVGTTSTRVLESIAGENGQVEACSGETNIFIYPGFQFKCIDGLITNFHLPKSSLLMLVSALIGRDEVMRIYAQSIEERYRFFSFGDAMLLL